MTSAITRTTGGAWLVQPQSMEEVYRFAKTITESDLCPKDYRNKPGNAIVAIQMGAEVGLQPMAALQNIAVINGRPSMWGDGLLAVCLADGSVSVQESFDEPSVTATCVVTRTRANGATQVTTQSFSKNDAERAQLWKKQGPWTQYPKRMLQMRARAFALRDACADLIRGMQSAEEQSDIPQVQAKVTSSAAVAGVFFHRSYTDTSLRGKLVTAANAEQRRCYLQWLDELLENEQDGIRRQGIIDHAERVREIVAEMDTVEAKALPADNDVEAEVIDEGSARASSPTREYTIAKGDKSVDRQLTAAQAEDYRKKGYTVELSEAERAEAALGGEAAE